MKLYSYKKDVDVLRDQVIELSDENWDYAVSAMLPISIVPWDYAMYNL